jgi:hypothetical protein
MPLLVLSGGIQTHTKQEKYEGHLLLVGKVNIREIKNYGS